ELVLALLVAAALARGVSGASGGALAAWLVATAVCLFRRGAFGEIDHNVTEVLGGLLLALLALRLFSAERTTARPWLVPILWASGVLVAMGFFAGLVLASGLVAAGHLAVDLSNAQSAGRRSALLSAGYALAAVVLPFTSSWRVRPDPGDPWRLGPVYVLILAAAAAGNAVGSLLAAARHRRLSLGVAFVPAGSLLAAAVVAFLQDRRAWGGFAKGLGFIGARDPWLSTIDEFQPLLSSSSAALVSALPALLVGAVAVTLALAVLPKFKAEERWSFVAIAVPFVLYALLAFAQKRFLPPATAFAAAAAGAAWMFVKSREAFRWAVLASLVLGLLVASSNLFAYAGSALRHEVVPEISAGEAVGAMLTQATPDPGNPPAWGVLAPWEYGHPILWTSGRPVALNNFGSFHSGFARATRLFLETSPSRAIAELSALRLRYVVAAYGPNVVPSAARSLGEDPRRYFPDGYDPRRVARYVTTPEGGRTLAVRLHRDDAAPLPDDGEAERAALRRFKKVWESPEEAPGPNGEPVPFLKLFEILPPA
ncbi:MAG TPA: hypothetical protein VGR00_14545, partial [Thermoanaerobaculia bacterium]|nr:hypothetical protein [Thermoanaerobaculia bacterium]